MCRRMKGNKTVYKNMGCHSEHTVVLHKHLKGAKQVSVLPMFQCSSLHPVCCHRLGGSAGELLQCSAVISQWSVFLKAQNKHSNVFYTKVSLQMPVSLTPALFKLFVTVSSSRFRCSSIRSNPLFKHSYGALHQKLVIQINLFKHSTCLT